MGRSTFTGPLISGTIPATSGVTVGRDIKNTGTIDLLQSFSVTQALSAAALVTNIVLPANSILLSVRLYVTIPWDGVAATVNLGTSVTANELAAASDAANTGVAIGLIQLTSGANATRTAKWSNVGTTDVQLWLLSTNTGNGVGRLVVTYGQNVLDS